MRNEKNYDVICNIIMAVETGGQQYGRCSWDCVIGPGHNTTKETGPTIGAAGWYGNNARELLLCIKGRFSETFEKLDTTEIAEKLVMDWDTYNLAVPSQESANIRRILRSEEGKQCQMALLMKNIKDYEKSIIEKHGEMSDSALMECINIIHQGGDKALTRILKKTNLPLTQHTIYAALKTDLEDDTNRNQVGDYKGRQLRVYQMINGYCQEDEKMSKIEKAIQYMEELALDDSHGYDQKWRWGEKGDYDCSGAVIHCWEKAGVPVKTFGASYTGNIKPVFLKNGFKDVTANIELETGKGLVRGDVLLRVGHHVAMYCGNNTEVEASINEYGKITGGKPGDQTGKEFLFRPYHNHPWDCVLRYEEKQYTIVQTATGVAGMITSVDLNVRSEPEGQIIKTIPVGTAVYPSCRTVQLEFNEYWFKYSEGWISGKYLTGWVYDVDAKKWWYLIDGETLAGLVKIKNDYFYFEPDGYMFTGWKEINGKWHYFDTEGYMEIGWQLIGGKWYHFNAGGVMETGWQYIYGKHYFLAEDGEMLHDQYVKNKKENKMYWLTADGSWDGYTVRDPEQEAVKEY